MNTLHAISSSLTLALGEEGMVGRKDLVNLYDVQTKAGEFVASDGTLRQAGLDDGDDNSGFSL
jgi:hypothetical protein